MNFVIKPRIEELLSNVIKSRDIKERQKLIIELKTILKIISHLENSPKEFKGINAIHRLPASNTGYSEYRILDDTDSEERSLWIEISDLKLSEGDVFLEMK